MAKVIELIVILTLLICSFLAGVKYSDGVRERAGWLFESKDEEVELPDLSNEGTPENVAPMDENGVNLEAPASANPEAAPTVAPVAPVVPTAAPAPVAPAAPTAPAAR